MEIVTEKFIISYLNEKLKLKTELNITLERKGACIPLFLNTLILLKLTLKDESTKTEKNKGKT